MGGRVDLYYIVHGGKALDAVNTCVAGIMAFGEHAANMVRKYSAKAAVLEYGVIVGLTFPEMEVPNGPWVHKGGVQCVNI